MATSKEQPNQLTLIIEPMKTAAKHQKSTDQFWTDEAGMNVPYARTLNYERMMEKGAHKLFKESSRISEDLKAFKNYMRELCTEVYDLYMKEKEAKPTKGNFTWFNFDRSVKIEMNNQEPIQFDDMALTAAKSILDEFLSANVDSKIEFVKEMVLDAFSSSNGSVDAKKVQSLIRYESRIKDALFLKAVQILKDGIRRPKSKTYFRIWHKDEEGKYQDVELNFSAIE